MKQLSSFMALNVDGGNRISYAYNEVDGETGNIVSQNNKGNFIVIDHELESHIEAIRDYIRRNKLEG